VAAAAGTYPQTPGATPTLPVHLRASQPVTSNGSPATYQPQQSYYASTYQMQPQPAR
jgi:hypothetical protein